jgi:hypothetical protein
MFSGYRICSSLKANEKCFCLDEYKEGNYSEIFHQHVPKHRISGESASEFMKALVVRHSALGNYEILRCYLNKRGKSPSAILLGQVVIEYPEPGVLRKYYSCGNISAWYDEVIVPTKFRSG